jgi:hypothetical protein|tara:strand:- start:1351 stop:1515 length:165 start_codon:yes stop_codon:yes gene_type:complete
VKSEAIQVPCKQQKTRIGVASKNLHRGLKKQADTHQKFNQVEKKTKVHQREKKP